MNLHRFASKNVARTLASRRIASKPWGLYLNRLGTQAEWALLVDFLFDYHAGQKFIGQMELEVEQRTLDKILIGPESQSARRKIVGDRAASPNPVLQRVV